MASGIGNTAALFQNALSTTRNAFQQTQAMQAQLQALQSQSLQQMLGGLLGQGSPSLPSLPSAPPPQRRPLDFASSFVDSGARNRQANQVDLIGHGLQSGLLSQKEAGGLLKQQGNISKALEAAKADGTISPQEAMGLKMLQMKAAMDLMKSLFNGETGNPFSSPGITGTQGDQIAQISDGIRDGSLNGTEASSLLGQQGGIADSVAGAQADGFMNLLEQFGVRGQQAGAQLGIDFLRNNGGFGGF
jgi:hypothetical protein